MSRIFGDGAEFGDLLFWSTAGDTTVEGTIKRTGNYSYKLGEASSYRNVSSVAEFYFRFAIYATGFGGSRVFCTWRNGTTILGKLIYNSGTGAIDIQRGSTTVGSGAIPLSINTWYLVEVWVDIANSPNGNFTVKIDGVVDAQFLNNDTQPGTDTTIDNIGWSQIALASDSYIDDIAFNDTAGAVNNSYPGDGHIVLLKPNGNGDTSQLLNTSGDSTNNYSYVDDVPPDDDTSYVESATSGQKDTYALENFNAGAVTILNVWAEGRARDTIAVGGQCYLIVKTGGVEYDSAAISLLTTYTAIVGTVHAVNPDTTIAWTDSDLDALQAGFKVV